MVRQGAIQDLQGQVLPFQKAPVAAKYAFHYHYAVSAGASL